MDWLSVNFMTTTALSLTPSMQWLLLLLLFILISSLHLFAVWWFHLKICHTLSAATQSIASVYLCLPSLVVIHSAFSISQSFHTIALDPISHYLPSLSHTSAKHSIVPRFYSHFIIPIHATSGPHSIQSILYIRSLLFIISNFVDFYFHLSIAIFIYLIFHYC